MGLLRAFWNCGDSLTIDFAVMRARLNRHEKEAVRLILDECLSQESAAEKMDISTRCIQKYWDSASKKLLAIPWVKAYAEALKNS